MMNLLRSTCLIAACLTMLFSAQSQTARPQTSSVLRFGTASVHVSKTRDTRWLGRTVSTRVAKKMIKSILIGSGSARFEKGAPGSYLVLVRGEGSEREGRIWVEVVIQGTAEGSPNLIEARGKGVEVWPFKIARSPENTQIYPPIRGRYRPKDKDGNPIYTSEIDRAENERNSLATRTRDAAEANDAFGRALKEARREAEAKVEAALR